MIALRSIVSRTPSIAILTAGLVTMTLVACGGNNGSVPPTHHVTPTATPTAASTVSPTATPSAAASSAAIVQSFSITIAAASSTSAIAARHLRPLYVSTNTASIRISVQSVDGVPSSLPPTIAATTPGAPGCSSTAAGLTCLVSASAVTGKDVFAIATYASANGTGTPLATTKVVATVSRVPAPPIALSLGGVPASLAFVPATLPLVNDGAIHRYAVTVDAVDASGATIVGASTYASGIALAIANDPTHALSLSTASVTAPGNVVTVTFDGSKSLTEASITATATGASAATLAAAPITLSPSSLFVYDNQTGGVAATVSQSGFKGTFTAALATPGDGSVAVTTGPLGSGSATISVIPKTIFDVTSLEVNNGTYAGMLPVTIAPQPGPYTAFGASHTLGNPSALVLASNGTLWTADQLDGSIVSFNPSTGSYATYVVDPNDVGPTSVAFDTAGTLWFADGGQIGSFNTTTHHVATYAAGLYSDSNVVSIARGPGGAMWFYDARSNNTFNADSPTAFGTISTASGSIVEFPTPDNAVSLSMVLGPDGALWFADSNAGAVGRVTSAGAYTSFATTGPISPNFQTNVLSNAPDGNIWFAGTNQGSGQSFIGDVNLATKTVAVYEQGVESGRFNAMIEGSDHNLWFSESPGTGDFFSNQEVIGVIDVGTHATYAYPAIVPQNSNITGLVDPGNRTIYMLDAAFGNIGKVSFR
jgi:streptogramin lyase